MTIRFVIAASLAVVAASFSLQARPIESWPYDKLREKSDLIVIVYVFSNADAANQTAEKPPASYLIRVKTVFRIQTVLKGEYKDEELTLLHYRLKENATVINGPMLVSFAPSERKSVEFLLFLKKQKDGTYEFVSGQTDPILSVRSIGGQR